MGRQVDREKRTVEAMIRLYCSDTHGTSDALCGQCDALLAYAHDRLDRCAFSDDKPACAKCPVHCYRTSMREEILNVMRYAGPRMISKHPVLAARHLLDARKAPGPKVEEIAKHVKKKETE